MRNFTLLLLMLSFVGVDAQSTDPAFDLRDVDGVNYVTAVKNQEGGTCWTHGVMSSVEGNLLINGNWALAGLEGEPDLSEYHLDWWNGFNSFYNQDTLADGTGLDVHYGGDYRVTSAYLSRGEGPIKDTTNYYSWYQNAPAHRAARYSTFYVRDIEWYTIGDELERIQTVKNKIVEHGVMGTCMAYDGSFIHSYVHYQPASSTMDPNHAIAIVGWDDTKTTYADEPGAWLCKNSWGSGWGNAGYFWISYYDKWAARHPEMGAVSLHNVVEPFFDTIYYHDYHGWRDTKTDVTTAMNVFEAKDTLMIKAVSFYTAADSVDYTMTIYRNFDQNQLSGEMGSVSGTISHTGFHTIDLPEEILVVEGRKFYMELELNKGGHPFDRTSEVPVLLGADSKKTMVLSTARRNQSFYKNENEQWIDFYDEGEPSWVNSGNFCIKAIADVYHGPLLGIESSDDQLPEMRVYPQPARNFVTVELPAGVETNGQLQVINISGMVQMSIPMRDAKVRINIESLPQGAYFVRVQTQNGPIVRQIIKY